MNSEVSGEVTSSSPSSIEPPGWFCPFRLPDSWMGGVQPLVFLWGLDIIQDELHRGVFEILNLKSLAKDFCPNYSCLPLNSNSPQLPVKKPKRDGLETYIPGGLLRANWATKHKERVPAVLVAFFNFSWTEAEWRQRKEETATRVKQLRAECNPHGTQLLVMLIKSGGSSEDDLSTERASALCAAAEIPPKSLYILAHSHPERIQNCVHRLESGMREAAKSYYSARVRRVRNWKERGIQIQSPLLVRYNFKLGFFHEIRRDYVASMSHYEGAMEGLLGIKVTDGNVQELKVIASLLNYRICRLHLLRMDWKDAKSQFDKHIRSFYKMEGNPELMFEHIAWLQQQYHHFGDLLKQHYRVGSVSVCDPVTYFMVAAKYAERRAKYTQERIKSQELPSCPKEFEEYRLLEVDALKYLGQRPWRADSFGPETAYTQEEPKAVQLLKYLESISPHSNYAISHLGIASEFCRQNGRLRTRCQLMSMMGVECWRGKEFKRCTMLMTHVLREFGAEKWAAVMYHVAEIGLKAACVEGQIASYIYFLIILLKGDLRSLVGKERRTLLWSNFQAVLDKRIPLAEQGTHLEMKKENWERELSSSDPIISYVDVHRESILEAHISFTQEAVGVNCPALIQFNLTNEHDFPVHIRKLGVRTNITEYNIEKEVDILIDPHTTHNSQLTFNPLPRDVGKLIQIQVGYVDIGKEAVSVLLHYSLILNSNPTLWNEWPKEKSRLNVMKVDAPKTLLQSKIQREDPALVGEWHKITVTWTNTDQVEITRIGLTFLIGSSDPQYLRLTVDPASEDGKGHTSHLSHSVDVDKLEGGGSHITVLYLRTLSAAETELKFIAKAKYFDGTGQQINVESSELLDIICPFELKEETTDVLGDPINVISLEQDFILHFQLENISKCPLKLKQCLFRLINDQDFVSKGSGVVSGELIMKPGEILSSFQLIHLASVPNPCDVHFASVQLTWAREKTEEDEEGVMTQSTLELLVPKTDASSGLYVKGEYGEGGRLKQPMGVSYLLLNRTSYSYDLIVSMESTEYFMNAGPKKLNIKLNGRDQAEFSYILFPLKTGLVAGPKLIIEHTVPDPPLAPLIHRDIPKTIFITRGEME